MSRRVRSRTQRPAPIRYRHRFFGSYLGDLMDDSTMSQREIAEKVGIPRPTLSAYRNGRILPEDPTVMTRMAAALAPTKDRVAVRKELIERQQADILVAFMDASGMTAAVIEEALALIAGNKQE